MTKKSNILLVSGIGGLGVGLLMAIVLNAMLLRSRFQNYEVTFLTPYQAVVFWKTKKPTLGFARIGSTKTKRETIVKQTSSVPSEVHAVMIDTIPAEGLFISLHEEGESFLAFPAVKQLLYAPVAAEGGEQ